MESGREHGGASSEGTGSEEALASGALRRLVCTGICTCTCTRLLNAISLEIARSLKDLSTASVDGNGQADNHVR